MPPKPLPTQSIGSSAQTFVKDYVYKTGQKIGILNTENEWEPYLRDFDATVVLYDEDGKIMRRTYTITEDGTVEIGATAVEVSMPSPSELPAAQLQRFASVHGIEAVEEDVLQLSKSGKRAIGRVGLAPSHAATSNKLLMN